MTLADAARIRNYGQGCSRSLDRLAQDEIAVPNPNDAKALRKPFALRKLTPETKLLLCRMLAEGRGMVKSCNALGFSYEAARQEMKKDPGFRALLDAARAEACENLEESVYDRASKNDTTAAIFMLKAMKPDTYGDRLQVDARLRAEIVVDLLPVRRGDDGDVVDAESVEEA